MAKKTTPRMAMKMRKYWNRKTHKFEKYAWPGGYPIFYFDSENNILCPSCASTPASTPVVEADVNYEDAHLHCDDCSKLIEHAY
jgi:formate dehydrogenase maturation protein FdhE